MKIKKYDRTKVVEYAKKWAYKRNPRYYNFDNIGGDCTSFVSQCIYAGCNIMNYKKHIGWYYNSINDRTASWSGVEFLYDFLIKNRGIGPQAEKATIDNIEIGDIVQLKFNGKERFSHSLIVVKKRGRDINSLYVASHTEDSYYRRVSSYVFEKIRYLHIKEIRID